MIHPGCIDTRRDSLVSVTQLANSTQLGLAQIPSVNDLPPFKEMLEPTLRFGGEEPLNTKMFEDGRRIPLLKELLEAVG